jgi:HAE1 family hydrophobic/amphiphilic exporter-1
MNITRISIERPTLLTVIYSLIIFFGIAAYLMLNYELVPKFNPPVITVVTVYPGATPQEVESEVTLPIEDALSSIENIDNLTSTSSANFSLVKLELVAGADVTYALEDAARNLETVRNDIAEGARQPLLTRFDFDDLPIIRMSLSADMGVVELTDFCNETIIPGLNQLEGVAEVSLLGGMEKELLVNLDQQRMRLLNVSILQVLKAIGSANADVPAGYLESESNRIPLTVSGKFKSLDDLRDLVVFELPAAGIFVRLSDIAEVRENTTERSVVSRLDGKASMGLNIKKQSEANAVEVSKLVVAKLSELENQYNHINLSTQFIQDSSQFTIKAANAVMEDLLLAILLVSLVMLVFLHSIRNALIVFVSIPTSIITTFLVMYLLGYSLNMLTLLGLSLAIGILVDDSIVIIENIHRHLEMGKSARKAAFEGRMEIGFTAISITLIDFVVYFPIILSTGMVPDLLRQFSVVIVASTIMSLFVSFTIAPYLASRFGHAEKNSKVTWLHKFGIKLDNMLNRLIDQLLKVLHRAYRHAGLVLFLSFVLFMGSILLIPFGFIGIEFTKAGDRSEFIIELELPGETPLSRTDSVSKVAESIIMGYPDVEAVYSNVGLTSSGRIVSNTTHLAELYVKLINKEERNYKTSLFARHIKYRLMESIPGLIARPVEINLIGLRDDDAVQITVSGNNKEKVYQVADAINDSLQIIQGAIEIKNSFNPGNRQIQVTPDRKTMDLLGINPAHVGLTIRTAFNGHKEFVFKKGEKQYDINIILDKNDRKSILDVKRLNVTVIIRTVKLFPLVILPK